MQDTPKPGSSEDYGASGYVVTPLAADAPADERREHRTHLEEVRNALQTEAEGAIVLRDLEGNGPEILPPWVRESIATFCVAYFLVTDDEGALLPTRDRERWDWAWADEAAVEADHRELAYWTCYVFTTRQALKRWKTYISFHNKEAAIAHIGASGVSCWLKKRSDEEIKRLISVARKARK